ncbi:MAG: MFS transporter [Armatimonadetes bacterium]|nr:MFS transporter [Armatimonadota bacterium]
MSSLQEPAVFTPEPPRTCRNPWFFVPTLYFMQGLPYMVANMFSVAMYKKLGVANEVITLWTSLFVWAWTLKLLWGPFVDSNLTKRTWVIATQALILGMFCLAAWGITLPGFFGVTVFIFFVIAFLSATHDIACDGFYLLALDKPQQAFFVGIRSAAFRLSMVFVNGAMIWLAGEFEELHYSPRAVWMLALLSGALVYGLFWLYGLWALPKPAEDVKGGVRTSGQSVPFVEAIVTFFQQPKIVPILLFVLLYRFGELLVAKIAPLFLLDKVALGGLELPLKEFGIINGTIGVIALIFGGFVGGWMISSWGLKRCLWPMVVCMHAPILLYVWAAYHTPDLVTVSVVVAVDNLGYGFGLAAYLVYLMLISQHGKYKTSHYAVATGIMAFAAMGAGVLSGYIQKAVGYGQFFVLSLLLTIPGTLTLFFIPLDEKTDVA